jgi:hypothetical protein
MEPNENKNKNSDTQQLDYSLTFESSPNTIHILLVACSRLSLKNQTKRQLRRTMLITRSMLLLQLG